MADGETQLGTSTEEDVENMSPALKTFICSATSTPDWCKAYKSSKTSTSIADWAKAKEDARLAAIAKAKAEEVAKAKSIADAEAKKREDKRRMEAAQNAADGSAAQLFGAKLEQEKLTARLVTDWEELLGSIDPKKLTINQVVKVREFADSGKIPEANEILAFAYANGSDDLPINLKEAYRQYAAAFLAGLKHVRSNMNRVWDKLKPEQQAALRNEFNR
ncbi:MAG: hypothetical protein HN725_01155 [Alphaproteobacteria bacterium]|nr:hypothetical protein [Alphaproteobacteria bacterium]MBT4545966.1 hypothetical protein [Alphaproteobacteria bacterium]MBT7743866.1 hypothetical protein [Alphaproteobacteria bacterium]